MLILHCILQCFLPFLQSVPSVKVPMSARINSEFVRTENDKFTSSMDGQKCVQHFRIGIAVSCMF